MHKIVLYLIVAAAVSGLLLFLPFHSIDWISQSLVLTIHVLLGIALAILLAVTVVRHGIKELFNPFSQGYQKFYGIKLLFYLMLAIFSGIILIFFSVKWIAYFHLFIGLWALLLGWKHSKN